ncbi:mRNA N(3)-methylcytidine methyltransferase METTL8 isoform X2 [Boleophthalmus pectinirostris]|uniref:mRNA N(3)-methylcytidine methyltransferase METTL8 isoform X2 n=1 Tax=Boleophthalmus pectinirostris TaxID=150288 RepID=UPI00242F5D9A|nr:mRNA N(3)-methylcytidine methyltransferase METTL8 isoform X2 [Boleophthalmus pectinirostris]
MHYLSCHFTANLAKGFRRLCLRKNSTGNRPAAPLGSRILTNSNDIFKHNMWDHVQWTEADKENARLKAEENSSIRVPLDQQVTFARDAGQIWEKFYKTHHNKFFKNRKWLFAEFPELLPSGQTRTSQPEPRSPSEHIETAHPSCNLALENNDGDTQTPSFPGQHAAFRILEVGCGVGNSVFPILNTIKGTDAFVYCCDFSSHAIELMKAHPDYDASMCHSFVHDICDEEVPFPFPSQSLDVILAVFVLSSIHPERMQGVVNRLSAYLKHGGIFLFRDYGRYDLSQLRFKKGRCLSENFYTRGDGTCVYYFTKEVQNLFFNAGLDEIQNLEDRRLQVNRGKKVVMRRVWVQSKFKKR